MLKENIVVMMMEWKKWIGKFTIAYIADFIEWAYVILGHMTSWYNYVNNPQHDLGVLCMYEKGQRSRQKKQTYR